MAEGRTGEYNKPRIQVDTSRPSTSAGPASAGGGGSGSGSGPLRVSPTARGQAQFHPYRRPQSGAGRSRRDNTEQHVRFAGEGQPQGSMSAPSPAPSSRIVSLGSTTGSMRCASSSFSLGLRPNISVALLAALQLLVLRVASLLSKNYAGSSFVQMSIMTSRLSF